VFCRGRARRSGGAAATPSPQTLTDPPRYPRRTDEEGGFQPAPASLLGQDCSTALASQPWHGRTRPGGGPCRFRVPGCPSWSRKPADSAPNHRDSGPLRAWRPLCYL